MTFRLTDEVRDVRLAVNVQDKKRLRHIKKVLAERQPGEKLLYVDFWPLVLEAVEKHYGIAPAN